MHPSLDDLGDILEMETSQVIGLSNIHPASLSSASRDRHDMWPVWRESLVALGAASLPAGPGGQWSMFRYWA